MAKKELTKTKKEIETKEDVVSTNLIISPRLTEKASNLSSLNVYTFNVSPEANKISLAKEIKRTYKVTPIKITVLNNPKKATYKRGKLGFKPGFKKAQVTLKKGDKINLA